jgi:hypothetical protein
VAIEQFLKQRAVNIVVVGNYTLPNWYDPTGKLRIFTCSTTRVSPFRMMVDVPVLGKIGDRLTSYFRDFGKFDGLISHARTGRLLLELEMTQSMRENLANKLTWLEKKQKEPSIPELRKDARIVPASPSSTVTLADGTIHACVVVNISASGVAVSSQLQPPIGTPLAIGAYIGRVIRLFSDGFAVKFIERQSRNDLTRLVLRASSTPDTILAQVSNRTLDPQSPLRVESDQASSVSGRPLLQTWN